MVTKYSEILRLTPKYTHCVNLKLKTCVNQFVILFYLTIINCFDGNGKQLDKGTLKDGNGTLNSYDIDGNLLEVQNFKDGEFIK